jgi:hypothetical protein
MVTKGLVGAEELRIMGRISWMPRVTRNVPIKVQGSGVSMTGGQSLIALH